MITKKLTALKPVHKILLTGTPLNNTVRELLNLMYFLDPEEWSNLDELERHYEDMTESLARELRDKIAPYMLRRRKEDVLDLPSKVSSSAYSERSPLQRAKWIEIRKERSHCPADNETSSTQCLQIYSREKCRPDASSGSSHNKRRSTTQDEGMPQYPHAASKVSEVLETSS